MGNRQPSRAPTLQRSLKFCSYGLFLVLMSLPFTTAFADNGRRGDFLRSGSDVPGWRLGGRWDSGGYQVFRRDRGGWRRVRGSGVYIYGDPRAPFILNAENEVYRWNGGRWRFVGRDNRYGFSPGRRDAPRFYRDQRRRVERNERRRDRRFDRNQRRRDKQFDRRRDRDDRWRRSSNQQRYDGTPGRNQLFAPVENRRDGRASPPRQRQERDNPGRRVGQQGQRQQDGRADRRGRERNRREDNR